MSIFDLHFLCNMKITFEAPRKKNSIVQCTRCQSYGHTKTYCANRLSVLNVEVITIRQSVPKILLPRRRAPFVVGTIQLFIKVAMSTAVSRQSGANLPPDHGVLILARPLHKLTLATLITSLPCYTLTTLPHPSNPHPPIPTSSPPDPRPLISGPNFPLSSPSSNPCLSS